MRRPDPDPPRRVVLVVQRERYSGEVVALLRVLSGEIFFHYAARAYSAGAAVRAVMLMRRIERRAKIVPHGEPAAQRAVADVLGHTATGGTPPR